MKVEVNRDKASLIKIMKTKSEKLNLLCEFEKRWFTIETMPGKDSAEQIPIPTTFKGTMTEVGEKTLIEGRFTHGFYLTTMIVVCAVLIAARLTWSVYKKQTDNIILCGLVIIILLIVCIVVYVKGKESKNKIEGFLKNLDKK